MPIVTKNKIIFGKTDWLSGLAAHQQSTSQNDEYVSAANTSLIRTVSMNPYRNYDGYASPGFQGSDATNASAITAALKRIVVHGSNGYASSGNARLHQITASSGAIINAGDFPHTVDHAHTNEVLEDVIVYSTNISSTRTARLFYSFNDDTDADVGTFDFSSTFDDNFMSTIPSGGAVLTNGIPHPMVVGADDILYIANGNVLASLDGATGANGTFTAAALTLPVDQQIVSFARIKPRTLVIFTYRSGVSSNFRGESTAWFWDYISADPYESIDLNDNRVGAAFEFQGTIGCFTKGRANQAFTTNSGKLKLWNGSIFETVKIFTDDIPDFGGVDTTEDVIVWNSEGKIYSYGNVFKFPTAMQYIADGDGTTNGACFHLANNIFGVSSGTSTSGGFNLFQSGYDPTAEAQTISVRPDFGNKQFGKITYIKTKFAEINSSTSNVGLDLNIVSDSNQTTTTVFADVRGIVVNTTVPSTNQSTMTRVDTKDSSGAEFPEFGDLSLFLNWVAGGSGTIFAPVIDTVEIGFETKTVKEN